MREGIQEWVRSFRQVFIRGVEVVRMQWKGKKEKGDRKGEVESEEVEKRK